MKSSVHSKYFLSAKREPVLVVIYLALFFLVALAVYTRSAPYTDEVMNAEMAINLVKCRGPVSFAHPQVTPGVAFVSSAPLHNYSLAAWLSVFGTSRLAVVSFNLSIVCATTFVLWSVLKGMGAQKCSWLRLVFVCALPWLPALIQMYGTNRHDSIGLLLLSLAGGSFLLKNQKSRYWVLFICAAFIPFSGLHVAIASAPLAVLSLLFLAPERRLEFGLFALGGILGTVGYAVLMYSSGSIPVLLRAMEINSVAGLNSINDLLLAPLRGGSHSLIRGGNLFLLAALFVVLPSFRLLSTQSRRVLLWGLFVGILVPITLALAGRYSWTYTWVAAIPMMLAICVVLAEGKLKRLVRISGVAGVVIAILSLAPLRVFSTILEWDESSNAEMNRFVASKINEQDVIYTTFSAYYPVKGSGNLAYFDWVIESMTEEQKANVTFCILDEDHYTGQRRYELDTSVLEAIGGEWSLVDRFVVERSVLRAKIPPPPLNKYHYNLFLFRREN